MRQAPNQRFDTLALATQILTNKRLNSPRNSSDAVSAAGGDERLFQERSLAQASASVATGGSGHKAD